MATTTSSTIVKLPESFSLDAYVNEYCGNARLQRLLFIALQTESIYCGQAAQLAIAQLRSSENVKLYQEMASTFKSKKLLPDEFQVDTTWIAETTQRQRDTQQTLDEARESARKQRNKSEEYKYNDMIGDLYFERGGFESARSCYERNQNTARSPEERVHTCFQIIRACMASDEYARIESYVSSALEQIEEMQNSLESVVSDRSSSATGASSSSSTTMDDDNTSSINSDLEEHKQLLRSKLNAVRGIAMLRGERNFGAIAHCFRLVEPELGSQFNNIVTLKDVALYGGLCALSHFTREEIKCHVLRSASFQKVLSQVPALRDAIAGFHNAKYAETLHNLTRVCNEHAADFHLHPHIHTLQSRIRTRALKQYIVPLSSARLHDMAEAFSTSVDHIERELSHLINNFEIKGRIDSQNKVLYRRGWDQKSATTQSAFNAGSYFADNAPALLHKIQLTANKIVVQDQTIPRSNRLHRGGAAMMGQPAGDIVSDMMIQGWPTH
mmetsp:Transcript_17262/g.25673  ORF Transcript_17262/g.25673 Transcript_17262/m.25673 type:complete len:498 (+) Transcript_17262:31-1524(+)|eukprot:CAMPEP_0201546446 /NCGR_PEP_ID=MMETSP0173_2-20130828/2706_1 /ASSEMBLY_ACC=CAM_ASM_000268 /TAXON_ID=218659 /ORGANISM="Vexillifera sp., Strain DIVA3 564/2" /LENGTH=497 /DNA_ID=CAMNT_0047955093 /DNA_START=20 /DNA_END=1513 /DNA_ORIENTATION=+